jgi:hypothetical protein
MNAGSTTPESVGREILVSMHRDDGDNFSKRGGQAAALRARREASKDSAPMGIARLRGDVARGRWVPAALAVALVAAQGASVAHFSIVKHAICPLHGELIHPGAEPHEALAVHATNGTEPGLFGSDDSDAFRDDHCSVVGVRREVALPTTSSMVLPQDVRPVGTPLTIAWVPTAETRFRIAPKQSPPA